jgi:diguanylate cyclase (GGDEF)-like protein
MRLAATAHRSTGASELLLANSPTTRFSDAPMNETTSPNPKTVILVADDEDSILSLLHNALQSVHYQVVVARDGKEALEQVQRSTPDLVILDVQMPELNGYAVCRRIKSDVLLRHIPVLMLTSQAGTASKVTGLEHGADDYLTKPFVMDELLARIKTLLRRTRMGLEANPISHLPGNVSIEREILARLQSEEPMAVLYFDLNSFKAYNDVYGFVKGDEVIRETARLILEHAHQVDDFVGHIGGDDFIVVTTPARVEMLCKTVLKEFDAKMPSFYSPEDYQRGHVEAKDRRGQVTVFPLLSLAVGVVTNQHRKITSLGEISKIGAEMKHFAKENKGSSYAIDRRKE